MIFTEYLILGIYFLLSFLISLVLFTLSYILDFFFFNVRKNFEKLSAYECGFQPFGDARDTFDVRFYLVAILFIIFDLEIAFIFPWVITLVKFNIFDICLMYLFLTILTLGFYYEWMKGGLNW